MNMNRRLEKLEDAMLRENGGPGYKLVMVEDDEMPEDAIATAGLLDWPPDRIFLISFVKADQKFP